MLALKGESITGALYRNARITLYDLTLLPDKYSF